MTTEFKVINKVVLTDVEADFIALGEALFFYHSWLRSELELVDIAHNILTFHCEGGKNSNYTQTDLYSEVESLLGDNPDPNALEWVHNTINDLSDMITEIHDVEGYWCGYHDGDWGLWPSMEGYWLGHHDGDWGL